MYVCIYIHTLIYLLTYLLICLFIYLCIHLFVYFLIILPQHRVSSCREVGRPASFRDPCTGQMRAVAGREPKTLSGARV